MTPLHYLSTLPLPDSWFDELARRMPQLVIHRVRVDDGEAVDPELLREVDFLHTGGYLPEAADAPALRCIQLDTSGVDHVLGTSLWNSDVPVATLGGVAPVPMAEWAMMAILSLAHHLPALTAVRESREWPSSADRLARFTPHQLPGATVGIVGYGRIGQEIARLCAAFGMDVIGVSRSGTTGRSTNRFGAARAASHVPTAEVVGVDRIDEVLPRVDYLVVVVPLTELTRGMLGPSRLDLMKSGAALINIARGGIVDEQALLERLRDGRIGSVAVDVFDDEPLPPDSPWWSEPNVLVTPHVAGLAPQYLSQTLELVLENLTRLAEGQPLLNEVDRAVGY